MFDAWARASGCPLVNEVSRGCLSAAHMLWNLKYIYEPLKRQTFINVIE